MSFNIASIMIVANLYLFAIFFIIISISLISSAEIKSLRRITSAVLHNGRNSSSRCWLGRDCNFRVDSRGTEGIALIAAFSGNDVLLRARNVTHLFRRGERSIRVYVREIQANNNNKRG